MSSARMTGRSLEPCEDAPEAPIEPEDVMDYHGLVAAHLLARRLPPSMGPDAEYRYWRDQIDLPRPGIRLLVSIATSAGFILMLISIAQD